MQLNPLFHTSAHQWPACFNAVTPLPLLPPLSSYSSSSSSATFYCYLFILLQACMFIHYLSYMQWLKALQLWPLHIRPHPGPPPENWGAHMVAGHWGGTPQSKMKNEIAGVLHCGHRNVGWFLNWLKTDESRMICMLALC